MATRTSDQAMEQCIQMCGRCAVICTKCSVHCLTMGGEHAGTKHQNIMRDCAEICGLAVSFMARESEHAAHVCGECAEICEACGDSCEGLGADDAMMSRCAEVCRECAETCRRMSGVGQGR
jgi:hypothetical protein